MEQFEPTTTASKSDKWSLNQALLSLWFDRLLPALQLWEEKKLNGNPEGGIRQVKSTIITMLWAVKSSLDKETLKGKEPPYDKVINIIKHLTETEDESELYLAVEYLESFLYSKGVLKWDTKEVIDRTQVWKTNQRFLG